MVETMVTNVGPSANRAETNDEGLENQESISEAVSSMVIEESPYGPWMIAQ